MNSSTWLTDPRLPDLLAQADLVVEGRLADASNATLRCEVAGEPDLLCVYKPVSGERPLWDFPEWTLTHRELAAYALSEAAGWKIVPPTFWRDDGPAGSGMCQLWIDEVPEDGKVAVVRPRQRPDGWLHVFDAEDGSGRPLQLVHADDPTLQAMTAFDAIVNNADRKGGHVLTDASGRVWGIDHGVTFASDEKLRTVLWGWAGERLPDWLIEDVDRLHDVLGTSYDPVDRWLASHEREELRRRVRALLDSEAFPLPPARWPAVPWPVF